MSFRHDRRRRVLAEEAQGLGAPDEAADEQDRPPAVRYHDRAQRHQQARVTDLVPMGYGRWSLMLLGGLLAVVGASAWDAWLPTFIERFPNLTAGTAPRPIQPWLSSLLLGTAAAVALLIYSLRRHRMDDYKSRYRVWLWTSLGLVLLSLQQTTGILLIGQHALALAPRPDWLSERWLWSVVVGVPTVVILLRLLLEMRHCRLGVTGLITCTTGWLLIFTWQSGWLPVAELPHQTAWQAGAQMLLHLTALTTVCWYARNVILDIDNKLPKRIKKQKPAKREKLTADASVDPPQQPKPHISGRSDLEMMPATKGAAATSVREKAAMPHATIRAASPAASAPSPAATQALSRAEKKRLKRAQRRTDADEDEDE